MEVGRPLAETAETVTLARRDYEALVEAGEGAIGAAAFRVEPLPVEAVCRVLAGESPVRLWRGHRGRSLRAVAEDARVSVSYLSEIENGRKPGSAAALRSVAVALRVPMESLFWP